MDDLIGRQVRIMRCLVDKPNFSQKPGVGWMLTDSPHDPMHTEPCEGVGKVAYWQDGDVFAIAFYDFDTNRQTILYARREDIMPTRDPYEFPPVGGIILA